MKTLKEEIQSEFRREKFQPYQDLYVERTRVIKGRQENTEEKYQIIEQVFPKDPHVPFTFIDLGANLGYFSLRLLHKYWQSVGVMIEGGPSRLILLSWLNKVKLTRGLLSLDWITHKELDSLSMSFDYVLAIDFLHWCEEWAWMLLAIHSLGKSVLISVPPENDKLAVGQAHNAKIMEALLKLNPTILGEVRRSHAQGVEKILLIEGSNTRPKINLVQVHSELHCLYPPIDIIEQVQESYVIQEQLWNNS